MTEVLTRSPDVETEIQFEQFDQIETVELLFPKLDGILLPIVIDNAEVVAPCKWMGGAEVSLTVALNNYYQLMTEENADEVIADVYEFLTGQLEPEQETELEPELDSTILIIEREEYVNVQESTGDKDETSINTHPIYTDTELEAAPMASPKRTSVETPTTRKIPPVRRQTNVAVEPLAKDLSRAPQQTEHQENILESREVIQPAIVQDIALVTGELPPVEVPLALEVDLAPQVDRRPLIMPTTDAGDILDEPATSEATLPISVSQEIEAVKDERSLETQEIETPAIEPRQEPLRDDDEDSEMDKEFIAYDYRGADELPEEPDTSYIIDAAQPRETNESEPSDGQIDAATQKINLLLTELRRSTEGHEANETDDITALRELANAIAELSESFESDEDDTDNTASDELIHERLLELYTELFEDLPLEHTRELAYRLARLTLEPQASRENDASRSHRVIHKKIKGLTIIVKKLKKAWNHVVAIGRLALRSHAIHETLYSSAFFCIGGERGRLCTGTRA